MYTNINNLYENRSDIALNEIPVLLTDYEDLYQRLSGEDTPFSSFLWKKVTDGEILFIDNDTKAKCIHQLIGRNNKSTTS